ncbi:hypothetical protein E2C01_053362 [Portunus trituberculatus]|uniref:Uncharacterized protein n=1 Tax=Portunus trituberculatus TaxID=210409 RepID=A0A5B7GP52_PORTR|nr:hypothetical protein [Portunus trituberculatus]
MLLPPAERKSMNNGNFAVPSSSSRGDRVALPCFTVPGKRQRVSVAGGGEWRARVRPDGTTVLTGEPAGGGTTRTRCLRCCLRGAKPE